MQRAHADEAALVTEAAAALDTEEIAIFRRAWAHWYGHAPSESCIGPSFLVYMFGGRAPARVCDYTRRIVPLHRDEPLDPRAWGSRVDYVRNPLLGFSLAALTVVVVRGLVLIADYSAQFIADIEGCLTPPCYDSNPTTGR